MRKQNRNFKLKIKDVRCFAGEQIFEIRPLTFLIGRNSTGKTTVMSCLSAIYNFIGQGGYRYPNFNEDPYSMGSFMDIISKYKRKNKTNTHTNFEIGIICDNLNIKYNFWFKEKDEGSEPVINQAIIDFDNILFTCEEKAGKCIYIFKDKKTDKVLWKASLTLDKEPSLVHYIIDPYVPRGLPDDSRNLAVKQQNEIRAFKILKLLRSCTKKLFTDKMFSSAPVRSKPQRTYNPIEEYPSPEGYEIPILLLNLKRNTSIWKQIHKNLIDFGKTSGLFSNIKIKKFGKTRGDPFQLQFQIEGVESNIIDTGYGLSQVLPLLVRLFTSDIKRQRYERAKRTRFLLQQPEVHLHPSAQAELASLFVKSVAKTKNSFLIETHSDYMLDRTRIEIRKGNISPNDVSFIYLESVKDGVKAHNMSIDQNGNLIDKPDGYRKFFIKETNRFLGFES